MTSSRTVVRAGEIFSSERAHRRKHGGRKVVTLILPIKTPALQVTRTVLQFAIHSTIAPRIIYYLSPQVGLKMRRKLRSKFLRSDHERKGCQFLAGGEWGGASSEYLSRPWKRS